MPQMSQLSRFHPVLWSWEPNLCRPHIFYFLRVCSLAAETAEGSVLSLLNTSNNVCTFYGGKGFNCQQEVLLCVGGNNIHSRGKKSLHAFVMYCVALRIRLKSASAVCFSATTSIYPHAACALLMPPQSLATHPEYKTTTIIFNS